MRGGSYLYHQIANLLDHRDNNIVDLGVEGVDLLIKKIDALGQGAYILAKRFDCHPDLFANDPPKIVAAQHYRRFHCASPLVNNYI